jgi:hypothetical protein
VFVAVLAGFIGQAAGASAPIHGFFKTARVPLALIGVAASVYATLGTIPIFMDFIAARFGGA